MRSAASTLLLATGAALAGCTAIAGIQDGTLAESDASTTDSSTNDVVTQSDTATAADVPGISDAAADAPIDAPIDSFTCGAHCAVEAALGNFHTCALLGDGTVSCWGDDTYGELGDNVYQADAGFPVEGTANATPSVVNGLSGVTAIAAGSFHTCAISGGKVYCWGLDDVGQCGDGRALTASGTVTPVVGQPTAIAGITNAVEIHIRGYANCARLADDTMTCWGLNGALGLGSPSPAAYASCYLFVAAGEVYPCTPTPQVSQGGAKFSSFTVGQYHTCGVPMAGAAGLECWGDNSLGELGVVQDGATSSATPVSVPLAGTVSLLSAGFSHTCVALSTGDLYCWGEGLDGELGDGIAVSEAVPTQTLLPPNVTVTSLAAGVINTCVTLSDGTAACAGSNYAQEDGYVSTDQCPSSLIGVPTCSLSFKRVPGLAGATRVDVGAYTACAVTTGGVLECWGDDTFGELGNGQKGFGDAGSGLTQMTPEKVPL
jgi:alpha-tubulin suppressor-like RCC1 family protein